MTRSMVRLVSWVFAALVLVAAGVTRAADSPVTVTVDTAKPGVAIPADFVGLSFEIRLLRGDEQGKRMFTADNRALVDMFKTVGIHNLRVGGNTSDTPKIPTTVNGVNVDIPNPVPRG